MLYALIALVILIVSLLIDAQLHNLTTSHRISLKLSYACKKLNDTVTMAFVIVLIMLCFMPYIR